MSLLMLFRPFRWWVRIGSTLEIFNTAQRAKYFLATERQPRETAQANLITNAGKREHLIFKSE